MIMKKLLQVSNIIALALTIAVNGIANTGIINNTTIPEQSNRYHTLITPADYTFSIWGLIYLGLVAFIIYQGKGLFKSSSQNLDDPVLQIGWWFVVSCLANSLWIYFWLNDAIAISVLAMLVLLFSLLRIIVNTKMERWDAPNSIIFFVWWPMCLYSGWITVATIVNVSAYLTKIGWDGFGLGEVDWTLIMLLVAGAIFHFMVWTRNMREYGMVGVWALIGIAMANYNKYDSITYTSLAIALILIINVAVHGYQNRHTSPFLRSDTR